MKPGSIITLKKPTPTDAVETASWHGYYVQKIPVFGVEYTCREIKSNEGEEPFILLEEMVIGFSSAGHEVGVRISWWRELLPPEAMQEQIKELLEEPVLI